MSKVTLSVAKYPNLKRILELLRPARILGPVATRAADLIEQRTKSGRGTRGRLAKYSKAYRALKTRDMRYRDLPVQFSTRDGKLVKFTADSGRRVKRYRGVSITSRSGQRDLTVTGRMWADLTHKVNRDYARLYFATERSRRIAGYNQQLTPFFGITNAEHKALNGVYEHQAQLILQEL